MLLEEIGKGGSSRVFKGLYVPNLTVVAVRIVAHWLFDCVLFIIRSKLLRLPVQVLPSKRYVSLSSLLFLIDLISFAIDI